MPAAPSLNVTGLAIDNAVFTTPATTPFVVPVGGSVVLDLTFTPAVAGAEAGTLDDHERRPRHAGASRSLWRA